VLEVPRQQALETFRSGGVSLMFDEIRASLAGFGVHFDVYFNEKDLHDRGGLDAALATLRQSGHVYETDGATWVRTTDFGDDKDRVYVRSSGEFTYFGADCAYYLDKRGRGFGKIILILGADHHGYVGRLRAIAACFGDDPDQTLEILIGQPVNLLRDGQPLRMSKRAGTIVTINDIVDAIGVDAARYALARYSLDSAIDLDLDLWTRRSNDNPVYYVQYAHARIASLLRTAAQAGITRGDRYDPALLTHDRENDLLKALAEFPAVVASAAGLRQPHRVARYLEDLSGTYHRFYDACRVLPRDDRPLDETGRARLWLAEAARTVLANGLGLLGVTAPDRLQPLAVSPTTQRQAQPRRQRPGGVHLARADAGDVPVGGGVGLRHARSNLARTAWHPVGQCRPGSSPRITKCLRRWVSPGGRRRYGFWPMRQQRAYGESGV